MLTYKNSNNFCIYKKKNVKKTIDQQDAAQPSLPYSQPGFKKKRYQASAALMRTSASFSVACGQPRLMRKQQR